MRVTNQTPAVLSPIYTASVKGDFEPQEFIKQTLAAPLFQPKIAGTPVAMQHNGNAIDEDYIVNSIIDCCGDSININAEDFMKNVFSKTLVYFDKTTPLSIQDTFSIQASKQENLPPPGPGVVYNPATDVIPISKQFLAGKCTYEKYFASLSFYARPNILGFYFANDAAFDAFKLWLSTQTQGINAGLPTQTNKLFADFQALTLTSLTESLMLRNNDDDNNDEYSFARMLIAYMMKYANTVSNAEFGVLPFALGELYCPKNIVFVNVEKHAHATAKQVADEWKIINQSINMKVNIVSNNKLNKLTGTMRSLSKIQGNATFAANQRSSGISRTARVRFSKTPLTTVDMTKLISKVIKKMANVAKSDNTYKSVKMTFAKPNRRDPDDFNKQGKIVSTKYKPDIHIYIDTSGSISERNYQDAVKSLIRMARKLNVNLYFNSFSHYMSQCSHLRTKDKSLKQVYATFQKIPKVSGGTDYEQIWHYINKSKKRKRELSIIMTDFEYYPPNHHIDHPKNLYYVACSNMDWNSITYSAEQFCKSMMHIDPTIRKHILC